MALIDEIPRVREALKLARQQEGHRLAEALQAGRVVGVLGEAEVGKSETISQAIGSSTASPSVIRLDLGGAASEEHVAFQLAKQIAGALLGSAGFSTLKVGVLVPAALEARRVELAELLGMDGLDEALRDWPSGRYSLLKAVDALEQLARERTVIVWIDHLEAPALTPRHPLDLDRFLWAIREAVQRVRGLSVLLSGRDAIRGQVLGTEAAFHQQGQWLSMDCPSLQAWLEVATSLKIPKAIAGELVRLSGGHPATMLLALLRLMEGGLANDAHEILRDLAGLDSGLTGRAMQHARSLHRLGGQVMLQVALGQGPYAAAQRGESPPQEIRKVLGRLQLAGLIRHRDGWSVVNPLVGIALGGGLPMVSTPVTAPDWSLDTDSETK